MVISATAPGKLVLSGDYAVLDGAPAIVLALQRRARAILTPEPRAAVRVQAPEIGVAHAQGHWEGQRLQWQGVAPDQVPRLELVRAVLQDAARRGQAPSGQYLQLDTRAFFVPGSRHKLGIGSSAALTVALAGALARQAQQPTPTLPELVALHRSLQGGRGSGLDVAASLTGGALVYQLVDGAPQARNIHWPAEMGLCVIWSGRSASTATALSRLAEWRQTIGDMARQALEGLGNTAVSITRALEAGRLTDMLEGLGVYADRLFSLGEASGIDIVCAEHRYLGNLAARHGLPYKSCGAGGGDIGVAISSDADRLADFAAAAQRQGFTIVEGGIDPLGLEISAAHSNSETLE